MIFGSQTSKTGHDIWKMKTEEYLCVMFYMFIFVDIYGVSPYDLEDYL